MSVDLKQMDRQKYVRSVFETALFFRDMFEEKQGGHTGAIKLLKPLSDISNKDTREFVLVDCYRNRDLNLTKTCLAFAARLAGTGKAPDFDAEVVDAELRSLCIGHEREIREVIDREDHIERSFLRAARYLQRIQADGAQAHSRVLELFVSAEFVPVGRGKKGPGHREHVVPCVYLAEAALDLFVKGRTVDYVARWLRPYLVIVEISKPEQQYLDGAIRKGGLGLKNKMPDGWQFDTGCIFQRLHDAGIAFDHPSNVAICRHT